MALTLAVSAGSASAQKPAKGAAAAPAPPPPPAPAPDPTPAPAPEPAPVALAATAPPEKAPPSEWDEFDVTEKDGKKYYFLGLRYRGAIIPKAFMNIFVSGGATIFSNSAGIELDLRKDGFSLIPNLTYTEYSTGDMLFLQHNQPEGDPGNWSMVNSGIKVLYAGADLLWSAKISKNFDFEYGLGFGLGVVFGNLEDNWVTPAAPTATYTNASGQKVPALSGPNVSPGYTGPAGTTGQTAFVPCQTTGSGLGCSPADHQNATTNKVGDYQEPHGFNPVPTLFLNVSIPQIGIRIKPIKSFVARLNVAFNIPNGFWFGFSGDYGLERLLDKK